MGSKATLFFAGFGGDQFSGGDQAFFVGQSQGLSRADGFVRGLESGDTYDGADDEIDFRMCRHPYRSRRAVDDFDFAQAFFF